MIYTDRIDFDIDDKLSKLGYTTSQINRMNFDTVKDILDPDEELNSKNITILPDGSYKKIKY